MLYYLIFFRSNIWEGFGWVISFASHGMKEWTSCYSPARCTGLEGPCQFHLNAWSLGGTAFSWALLSFCVDFSVVVVRHFTWLDLSSKRTKQKLLVLFMAEPRVSCVILVIVSWSEQSQLAYLQEKRTAIMLQSRVMWSYAISHNDSHMVLWLWLCLPWKWNLSAFF